MYRIAEARELRGWTQEQLAASIGTTQQTIQRWESGQTEPKLSSIKKISKALGITLSFIINITDESESEVLSDDEHEVIFAYRSLAQNGKRALLAGLREYVNQ